MDWHPIQGGVQYSQLLRTTEAGISSGGVGLHGLCATLPILKATGPFSSSTSR